VELAKPTTPKSKEEYSDWSQRLRRELLQRVFRDWPDEMLAAEVREERDDGSVILRTENEVSVLAKRLPIPPEDAAKQRERLWLVVLNADEPEGKLPAWAKETIPPGQPVTVLSPRGCGEFSAWTRKNPPNYVERSHVLLGRTVDTGRVWDIQATARWLHEASGNELTVGVIGKGPAGVLGAYAALFENCISEITLIDPPSTHRDGPIFLNVMRVLDVPDAIGLLSPRRVTLINAQGASFDRAAESYKAAGYAGRISRR
jgi:hypothetical protein